MALDSLSLPTMENAPEDRRAARARAQGEELTATLRAPLASITSRTREVECNSPLFRDSLASGQPGLFTGSE
jgi:hypothetical protein